MFQLTKQSWIALFVVTLMFLTFLNASGSSFGQSATATETPFPTFAPLATQVGFSDAEIAKLQAQGSRLLSDDLKFDAYGRKYRLLSFQVTAYKAKPEDQEYSLGLGTVLLYRQEGTGFRLVWKLDTGNNNPYLRARSPLPGDWHGDGHILIGIWHSWWTTGWYQGRLEVYELRADETIVPVLKRIIPPGYVAESIVQEPDNKYSLVAGDYRDAFYIMGLDKWSIYTCCGPYLHRYFEWQNGQYVDISAERADKYYAALGNALHYVTTTKDIVNVTMPSGGTQEKVGPQLFSLNLLRLLVSYETIGEREAGYNLVQSLVGEAKRSGRLRDGTYVDQVFMPIMAKLFKDGKPFVAPDYVLYRRPIGFDDNQKEVFLYPEPVVLATETPVFVQSPTAASMRR